MGRCNYVLYLWWSGIIVFFGCIWFVLVLFFVGGVVVLFLGFEMLWIIP